MHWGKRRKKHFDILIWLPRLGSLAGTLPTSKFEMHNNSFLFPIRYINMRLNLAIGMNINDLWFWCLTMTLESVHTVSLFTNKSVKLRAMQRLRMLLEYQNFLFWFQCIFSRLRSGYTYTHANHCPLEKCSCELS